MIIDLHTHTTASDGTLSPRELLDLALKKGVEILSITDHDSISGVREVFTNPLPKNLTIVPGIELNTEKEGQEFHILGYYIDIESRELHKRLEQLQEDRALRIRQIIQKLKDLKINLSFEEVMEYARGESVGRLHVARALKEKKIVNEIQDAFQRFLKAGCEAYVPRPGFLPEEAVEIIKNCSGIPVLAHPIYCRVEEIIDFLVDLGLRGIEVYYPDHTPMHLRYYREIAMKKKLLITGGSDFHGFDSRKYSVIGNTGYPGEYYYSLKKAAIPQKDLECF